MTHENMCNIFTFINFFDKLAFLCRGPIGVHIIIQVKAFLYVSILLRNSCQMIKKI